MNDSRHSTRDGIHVFRNKHLFAELHELRGDGWHEVRRWNYGLEEDLEETEDGCCHFGKAHLPSLDVYGAMAFRESLHPELVLLDVEGRRGNTVFEPLARAIVEHLVADRQMAGEHAGAALQLLTQHLDSAKRVEHDDDVLQTAQAKQEKKDSRKKLASNLSLPNLFRAATQQEDEKEEPSRPASPALIAIKDDALAADAEEEAAQVLIDDDFKWIASDVSILVRLRTPVCSGLEEHIATDLDESSQNFRLDRALKTRFIVLVLGASHESHEHNKHIAMGAAAAALLQDDGVVRALYEAQQPSDVLRAVDSRLRAVRVLPRTTRPTKKSLAAREKRMGHELEDLKQRLIDAEAAARQSEDGSVADTFLGGRVMRLEYADQGSRWTKRQRSVFRKGRFTIHGAVHFAQKYALPLLFGIFLAILLANTDEDFYQRWCGVSHHGNDDDHRRLSGDDDGVNHPTLFGLRLRGHDITLHFLVNDVLMAFFFGLAVKEICEAFQPGGSLYPPTRKAVNPIFGTLGGVIGPVALYFILLAIASGINAVGLPFSTLATGWGIPTATDISVAWVVAYTVFGAGHPAINFLLLCAIIDDGIGLVIIAVVYREENPDPKPEPVYLLLVGVAMLISYILRKLRVAQWWVYVALAGPFAWYGLLYAAVHPSLALCFVVPFLPLSLDKEKDDDLDDSDSDDDDSTHKPHVRSPLHDFEHATKGFVDFVVLFLFGLCNAGVNLNGVGGYSLVVFLSLLLGKTVGLVGGSMLASSLGFPRPDGMSFQALLVVGVISSVGLTVSLFIAGEAFANEDGIRDQAKFGALLSLLPALLLIVVTTSFPSFKRVLVGDVKHDDEMDHSKDPAMPAIDEDQTAHHAIDVSLDPEEEDLEEVIVQNMEHALRRIHRVEHRCERKHGISRHQSLVIMNGLPKTSSDSKLQVKPRKRSPSPQPLPTQGLKRNQSSEALIDQLIEKHITRSSTPPPPPTDTPRIAGRPPRPPRARSVGSLQSGSPPSAA